MDQYLSGRLYRRIVHKYLLNDVMFDLRLKAKAETVEYILPHLKTAVLFEDRNELHAFALEKARASHPNGLVCEFGVAGGKTLRKIAAHWKGPVHGFDSFEGLPEDWTGTAVRAGGFHRKGRIPSFPGNVTLHKGWFHETIPPFLAANPGPAAFLHMDADIYASTKTALSLLRERIAPGAVIVFDEYYNYPNWREHEFKAFQEFIAESGLSYRYIAFSTLRGQAAVQIV
jgi:hypothetical protein